MVSPDEVKEEVIEQRQPKRKAGRPRKEDKAPELREESESDKHEDEKVENPESHQAEEEVKQEEPVQHKSIIAPPPISQVQPECQTCPNC